MTATIPKTIPVKRAAATPASRQRRRTKDVPSDKVGNGGNSGLLTTTLADRLIGVVETGVPLDVAIAYVGVHRETLRKWRRRGDRALEISASRRSPTERRYADFVQRLDAAMAETSVLAQATLRRLIMGPRPLIDRETGERTPVPMSDTDKRIQADLVKFYLSRRERRHYGATVQAEISGPNGGPILSADMSGEEAWEAFTQMFGEPNDVDDD
jgi:hypothetical protein